MLTNYLLVNELAHCFCGCFLQSFHYRLLSKIIHCCHNVLIFSSRDYQWSHNIYSDSLKQSFRWYRMDNIIFVQSSSSLTIIASFYIISDILVHLRSIISLLNYLEYFLYSNMPCHWAVMKYLQ